MRTHLNTHCMLADPGVSGELLADVRLGSPRFADCRGVGICAIHLDEDRSPRSYCRDWCRATLQFDRATGRLLLGFHRSSITDRTFDHHFASGYLKVQQPYTLPLGVAQRLALPSAGRQLHTGVYPILDVGDLLLVSCRLSEAAVRTLPGTLRAA